MSIKQAIEELEKFPHIATGNIRWRRPRGGSDNDLILEQEWEIPSNDGRRSYWAPVQKFFED